ncbi:PIR Superfamily Protein [Plasmodium ovale curtisi]|uniref:PIR Superfamily Protein n=1 Tax=Plasmodium ovale curtisi TaxID=864141 RepID=A0A1A8WQS1_PLAOA|nr:PIR Superfamily Protein [Plasmodium ovale curtisi]
MNTKFSFKSGKYLKDSSNNSSLDYDKRCKHINYLINLTISKITSLNDNVGIKVVWFQKIKECRDKLFRSNPWLNCNENNKYDKNMEILGKFFEDSDFIKKNLSDIHKSKQCQNIFKNISTR